jgi:RimJ/RimL family protein N-acetyltransferase
MSDHYFLDSDRLKFRRWSENDIDLAKDLWGNDEVTKFIGGSFSFEQIQTRLLREISNYNQYGIQYWPVFLRKDNSFIGCCGLRPYKPEEKVFEIGFHLCSDYWGHGYATEAAKCIIQYAFDKIEVSKLFAGHNPNNTASKKVLNRLGFQYVHDEYYQPTGLYHPSYELSHANYLNGGNSK